MYKCQRRGKKCLVHPVNWTAPMVHEFKILLEVARSRRPPLPEIVLWIAASRSPSESQTSECRDRLSRSRATFVIMAQGQPGKLTQMFHAIATRAHTIWTRGELGSFLPHWTKASSTRRASQAVPHPSTDRAFHRLASGFR